MAMASQIADMTMDEMIDIYVKLRDKAAEKKAAYEADVNRIKVVMERIETRMMEQLNASETESARSKSGTAYKSTLSTVSVADGEAFLDYVRENDAWQLLTRAASKTAVEAFVEENGDLPPGVNLKQIVKVQVRRA